MTSHEEQDYKYKYPLADINKGPGTNALLAAKVGDSFTFDGTKLVDGEYYSFGILRLPVEIQHLGDHNFVLWFPHYYGYPRWVERMVYNGHSRLGLSETWERQLRDHLASTPVLAAISGLGGKTWAPVHHFCESAAIPCLLPNIDLPVVAEQDFYPIYFSKGVLLEAQLISRHLQDQRAKLALRRVVQLYREGDIGEEAAKALETANAAVGLATASRALKTGEAGQPLAEALKDTGANDAVILWLRPDDLRALPVGTPASAVYISGLIGGLENAPLPAAWRGMARLTYPFDLPDLRRVRMNFPLGWFKVKHLPVVNERVQTDTYLACVILSETLGHMLDSFVRDYLVERVEVLLSHRLVNGHYPRLGLAPGQRFASKGGYIVRFAQPDGTRLVADGDWLVP